MYLRLTLAFLITFSTTIITAAQQDEPYSVPRTEHGHPDFQGVWMVGSYTPLERPDGVESLIVPPEQAAGFVAAGRAQIPEVADPDFVLHGIDQLSMVRGEYRSSVIVQPEDGKIPYTVVGLELVDWALIRDEQLFDHPEQRPRIERCLGGSGNPPMRIFPVYIPRQIVQNRDHVMIYTEDPSAVRIIQLGGSQLPQALRSVNGNSTGHWEGDTLVIQTTHFRADDPARLNFGRAVLIGEDSYVLERFTRVSESQLLYQYTIEDPTFYTESWSGEFPFDWFDGNTYEYSCHEGNYSMAGMLRGGQLEAARLAEGIIIDN